ncbi:hypothetical protein [Engelhardtia mirabilis]|uniref:BRCT domain-containing protein n=1 Tax=Engelhardtia mirabilis TaxID=2528011 RepID=A0A518BNS9_9BACT|nr:hypothetical protein Pla133_37370 [Planctomycetes bacterium Pla133]QDV02962.1 hypothetical protein Pla86_37360 [Planctomycetes bacterium Pla86]
MSSAKRGAAQVSVVWVITFGVIALASIFFGYIAQDDKAIMVTERDSAVAEMADSDAKFEGAQDARREVSRVLGFYDTTSADIDSNVDTAKAALESFKDTFSEAGDLEGNFQAVLPIAERMYRSKVAELSELQSTITRQQGEIDTVKTQRDNDLRAKDEEITRLSNQLRDEQANASEREDELQRRLAQASGQADDLDQRVRQLQRDMDVLGRDKDREIAMLRGRLTEQGEKLAFLRPAARELPDARIVSVSSELGLAWIDIGANQRLARGVGFKIQSGKPGAQEVKAIAEVTQVMADMAEIQISGLVDPFDPVVPGDVLINELYDPTGERNAVLIGRFSGSYDEGQLRALLGRMGINVQDSLSLTTDYAIVGSEVYVDEFGDAYEEPVDPSNLPIYSEAVAQGCKVIPIAQVREYFKF